MRDRTLHCLLTLGITGVVSLLAAEQQPPAQITEGGCTFASRPTGVRFSFEFTRPTASIRDDGRGTYTHGVDGVEAILANAGARLYPFVPDAKASRRTLTVDLSRPVDAQAQQSFGTVQRHDSNFRVLWKQDTDAKLIYGIMDIPIGTTVRSERVEASVMVEGRQHVLRFGDVDVSVCWPRNGPTGEGTARAAVTRTSEAEWRVDLPVGSRGRLWDLRGQPTETTALFSLPSMPRTGPPTDRGLYYADTALTIRRQ